VGTASARRAAGALESAAARSCGRRLGGSACALRGAPSSIPPARGVRAPGRCPRRSRRRTRSCVRAVVRTPRRRTSQREDRWCAARRAVARVPLRLRPSARRRGARTTRRPPPDGLPAVGRLARAQATAGIAARAMPASRPDGSIRTRHRPARSTHGPRPSRARHKRLARASGDAMRPTGGRARRRVPLTPCLSFVVDDEVLASRPARSPDVTKCSRTLRSKLHRVTGPAIFLAARREQVSDRRMGEAAPGGRALRPVDAHGHPVARPARPRFARPPSRIRALQDRRPRLPRPAWSASSPDAPAAQLSRPRARLPRSRRDHTTRSTPAHSPLNRSGHRVFIL